MGLLKQWSSEGFLTSSQTKNLTGYVDLLVEWNSRINLTGLTSRDEIEEILIGETLLAVRAFSVSGKRVLDIGSGAGVPGLIWLLQDPTIRLTSLEVREKKIAFQKEVVRTLGLKAEILQGRFPIAVEGRVFDLIATRAVRYSEELLRQAALLLAPGGNILRFAGPGVTEPGWRSFPVSKRTSLLVSP